METRWKIAFWVLMGGTALILLVGARSVPLLDPDESRFARTSVEMMRSGDLVVPRFEGQPRLVKPPLVHWIQCALFRVFGATEWAARFHAAAATLASIGLLAWVLRPRFGREGAFWAALVLATIPLVAVLGRLGTLDALLALQVLAVVALDLVGPRESGLQWSLALGGALGLAFLVKGPVGVVLGLLIMLAGRTATGRRLMPAWRLALAAVGGWCLVVLPWGLNFLKRVGLQAIVDTVRVEALDRYLGGTAHVEPPWFYLLVILAGFFPWQAPLLLGLVRLVRRRHDPSAATALYCGAAFVVGVLFLSLGEGKLPNYILPLAPLAAVVVAWGIGYELAEPRRRFLGSSLLAGTLGALSLGIGLVAANRLEGDPRLVAITGSVIYGLAMVVCLPALLARRPRPVYLSAGISTALFLLVVMTVLLPAVARTRTSAYLIEEVPVLRSGRPVLVVDMKVPSLTYYLDRVPELVLPLELEQRLDAGDDPLVVLDEVDLPQIPTAVLSRLREIGRQGKYRVYERF